jgi:hypothetical protein
MRDHSSKLNQIKLPVLRKVSGIGNVTEQLLKRVVGVEACGQLIEKRAQLLLLFSEISAGQRRGLTLQYFRPKIGEKFGGFYSESCILVYEKVGS